MKSVFSIAIFLVVSCFALEGEELHAKWQQYKLHHSKAYEHDEEQLRKSLWHENFKMVEEHNKLYEAGETTFDMEQNQFSDMKKEELNQYLNAVLSQNLFEQNVQDFPKLFNDPVPDTWDWRTVGGLNPVVNQGLCGCCWTFSSVAALEFQYWKATNGTLVKFSQQQLLNCVSNSTCRRGGTSRDSFRYLKDHKLQNSTTYPYIGKDKQCTYDESLGVLKSVTSWKSIAKGDEVALKNAIYSIGPITNTVSVLEDFVFY
ncbi:Cathepsin L2, partial [Cichlidogyrus casuarinus]